MQQYDLNFIEEPDWGRESSYDPRFLLIVAGVVLLLLILSGYVFLAGTLAALENEKLAIDVSIDKTKREAAELTRMRECTALWVGLVKKSEAKTAVRLPFSRLLSAWAEATPGNVHYSSLAIRSRCVEVATSAKDATGKAKATRSPMLSHEITCQAVATGGDAAETLYQFAQAVLSSPFLAYWVVPESVALTGGLETLQTKDGIGAKGPFVAKLKDVDWYNEATTSTNKSP